MSRLFFSLAFAIGAAVACWIGAGFVGSDPLALAFTGVIAVVYCLGFGELLNFRGQTHQLAEKLDHLPQHDEALPGWLEALPHAMQFPVQRRIEGHAAALPGPQLTPYLTGLLVMLGLLGTFAGMVVTLGGAASALDNSTELSAIRNALAAPIDGLSLAFGTSIAGVATSAMLGLAATLSRRDRLQVSQTLDRVLRQTLHHLSADHQRQQAFRAMDTQAKALPDMVCSMERMTTRMEQLGQQLEQSLTRNQQAFHNTVGSHYQGLAESVAKALKEALDSSARQTSERVEPVVRSAVEQLQSDAHALHRAWYDDTRQQLAGLSSHFQATTAEAGERWQQNLAEQQTMNTRALDAIQEHARSNRERDNELLEERQRLVQELDSVLASQRHNADRQRESLDSLLSGAGGALTEISERFNTLVQEQSRQLGRLGEDLTGSSQEVGALSEAFSQAIELFSQSNTQVIASLADIQRALDQAGTRHDEQLAYYVAQAREVIDLSISAQQDMIDSAAALRRPDTSEAS